MSTKKRVFQRVSTLLCVLALFAMFRPAAAQSDSFREDFSNPDLPGWQVAPGTAVVDGALRLSAGNFASRGGTWADFTLTFAVRREGSGGLIVTYRSTPDSTFIVVFHDEFLLFQREVGGELTELGRYDGPILPEGAWQTITLTVQGDLHLAAIGGGVLLETIAAGAPDRGGITFEAIGAAAYTVDDVVLTAAAALPPPAAAPSDLTWVRTGGPLGGLGYDVRMRPGTPAQMYVTDAFAGVFRSEDGGQRWYPANNGIDVRTGESGDGIPIFCLTIDPHDPQTIWIGTQNVRGIFKSSDGGQTWQRQDSGVIETEGITFRGITVDPGDRNTIYAAAEISSWAWAGGERSGREFDKTRGVLYRSRDGGASWTAIWRGDNLGRYIWVNPQNSDIIYLSTGIFDREAANSEHTTNNPGGEGVLKSTDGGATWQQMNNGLQNLYVGSLFMHPENPDVLLAGTGNITYADGNGIYLSTDGAASWQLVRGGDNINAVEFAAANPQIAYAGSAGSIYRSQDGGLTWQTVVGGEQGWGPPGVQAGFPIDFEVDPTTADRLFANNYGGGNFVSEDGGATWAIASDGYTGAQVRAIAVHPQQPALVYAAARSGFFASGDGGQTWTGRGFAPATGLEWNVVAVNPSRPNQLVAANNWMGRLLLSDDGAAGWQIVGPPMPDGQGWRVVAFAPAAPDIVYAGTSAFFSAGGFDNTMPAAGVYRSLDGGRTWAQANDSASQNANVSFLAVAPDDADVVYAASGNNGLLKSTNGGGSWTRLPAGGTAEALAIAVNPQNPNLLLAGFAGAGLFRSEDGGQSWQQAAAGFNPEARIKSIQFHPSDPELAVAADSLSGVYQSLDGGQNWTPLGANLLTRAVNQLVYSGDGRHLYAATEGGGVFRLDWGSPPAAAPVSAPAPEPDEPPVADESPDPAPPTEPDDAVVTSPVPVDPNNGAENEPAPTTGTGPCSFGLLLPLLLAWGGVGWRRRR